MSLDFFQNKCQEPARNDIEFGLCDDQNGGKAYTDTGNRNIWVATVKNDNMLTIVFTAIDKCVIQDTEERGRGRCDGMLTTEKHLYLVELKEQDPPWRQHAIEQLVSTIQFLKDNHDISQFKLRKAFASNKRQDKFAVLDNEYNLMFFRNTGFRIDIQAEIVIF